MTEAEGESQKMIHIHVMPRWVTEVAVTRDVRTGTYRVVGRRHSQIDARPVNSHNHSDIGKKQD